MNRNIRSSSCLSAELYIIRTTFPVSYPRGSVYISPVISYISSHLLFWFRDNKESQVSQNANSQTTDIYVTNQPKLLEIKKCNASQEQETETTSFSSLSPSHAPWSSTPQTLAPSTPPPKSTNSASPGNPSQDTHGKDLTKPPQESALTAPYLQQSPNSSIEIGDDRDPQSE